jgi:hypothetical protein
LNVVLNNRGQVFPAKPTNVVMILKPAKDHLHSEAPRPKGRRFPGRYLLLYCAP